MLDEEVRLQNQAQQGVLANQQGYPWPPEGLRREAAGIMPRLSEEDVWRIADAVVVRLRDV